MAIMNVVDIKVLDQRTLVSFNCNQTINSKLNSKAKQKICLFPVALWFELGSVGRLSIFFKFFLKEYNAVECKIKCYIYDC